MEQQTMSGSINVQDIPVVHNPRVTGGEVACLWSTFQQYTMLSCVFSYFERTVQDQEIKAIISDLMPRFSSRTRFAADIFRKEGIPIPMGLTDQDVNPDAPPLFSEIYILHFLKNMIRVSLTLNTLYLNISSRPDIRDFYTGVLQEILEINTRAIDLMLSKGVLPRPPYLSLALEIERVHEPSFLAGFLGEKRPLLTMEVAHIYQNALSNEVGRALLMGFRQVSRNREVQDYFEKGMRLADNIIRELLQLTRDQQVYPTLVHDEDITACTEAPFSDKLMMAMTALLNSIGIGMNGVAMGVSMRHDLHALYAKYMTQIGRYAEEGAKLMIANDWLEEPPQILDREKLAVYKH
ncbi:MAG: DUF3231 family protein [Syntrophomonadaceae bacterium]